MVRDSPLCSELSVDYLKLETLQKVKNLCALSFC